MNMANCIMMQGTSSHVGKSILVTALCRILYQDGVHVVPFKAQNMALNSYVTRDGKEMGRAQVAQAEAAGLEPMVEMNPVLLKPTGNASSQIVVMGQPVGNMSAKDYHKGYSVKLFGHVKEALAKLQDEYDTIVIEGAGSPAEVNLHDNDIVNMRVAKYLNAPVFLIADIDRGGALASLVGTLELLEDDERDLVKGLIINKFRGDVTLLKPAVDFLEKKTGKPVLGIIPHLDNLGIDDEDSVSLEDKPEKEKAQADLHVAVMRTPKISNFTDFDAIASEKDVSLHYVTDVENFGHPDLIMLPGSKNTTEDLLYLRESGLEKAIKELKAKGVPVIGICGGYQMLGEAIMDPLHMESDHDSVRGLGLLPMKTTFSDKKLTSQVTVDCPGLDFLGQCIRGTSLRGYEIHMGQTEFAPDAKHPLRIIQKAGKECDRQEGLASEDGLVFGTYVHGIFDNDEFRRGILNALRQRKGLEPLANTHNTEAEKQHSYNRLAAVVRESLDMEKLREIMGET